MPPSPDGADWRKVIWQNIKTKYDGWDDREALQAHRIISHIKGKATAAEKAGHRYTRPSAEDVVLEMTIDPTTLSLDNVKRILCRTSKGDAHWVEVIYDWVVRHWDKEGKHGQKLLVETLLDQEERYYGRNVKIPTTDDVVEELTKKLDWLRTQHSLLLDLPAGLRGSAPHLYPSIGHRAARHYGINKAGWDAAHRWQRV
ncbi:hypothetical protein JCM11641_007061 [Rhodosporidiobolus odoratus]